METRQSGKCRCQGGRWRCKDLRKLPAMEGGGQDARRDRPKANGTHIADWEVPSVAVSGCHFFYR
ncbi:conserved hypothetical protein [Cupriavidus taiwanensis]|nr:conserved hypothetical protein [Cupriavidus taiwanensis]SOZ21829.1 conserved hypothetical protein [Cupriavidus taiwanensis]SOZ41751.1 conserved hypothetical protein [Cupriavidus taiwanensis]